MALGGNAGDKFIGYHNNGDGGDSVSIPFTLPTVVTAGAGNNINNKHY